MEPKTKRSYGKRKSISVPELLAVRVEMTSEEAAKSNNDQIELIAPETPEKVEPIMVEDLNYDAADMQEISVYEDVQEIDWIEQTEQSQAKVEVNWTRCAEDANSFKWVPFQAETRVIGQLETTTIFDENATAYNVIVTEHGSFILSNYDPTVSEDGTTVQVDAQSSSIHEQDEVIILSPNELYEHIEYENEK